jgi:hypothetical protein
MVATDYPFEKASRSGARRFLKEAALNDADRQKIAFGNWDHLCVAIRR